jgi:sugar lactone lactonase YvrE
MIRKVSADGTVSLFAGSPGWTNGLVNDGPRLSATFWQITALAFDAGGNLWVGHSQTIRMIDTTGNVSTIAGGTNCPDDGDRDGRGASACLIDPTSITALPDGSGMVFSEAIGSTIRFIDASGNVRTWAGSSPHSASIDGVGSAARFASTSPIAIAPDGSLWVGSPFKLRHVLPNGQVTSEDLDTAVLLNIGGMAFDSAGNLYLTDVQMHRVVKRSTSGTYSIVAGVGGVAGHDDGPAPKATFNGPQGIAVAKDGTLYVADRQNGTIRHIAQDGSVSTVAGAPGSSCQSVDGMLGTNRLCSPYDLTFDSQGRLLISDIGAAVIRRLETDGRLITFAGTPSVAGYGEGPAARFRSPGAIAVDAADNIYVADGANSLIRRVTPDGITSTVIGHLGTLVLQNALDGAINQPTGLVVLANGHLVFGTEGAIVGD